MSGLIINTNQYHGVFAYEMCSYITGLVPDYAEVQEEYVGLFSDVGDDVSTQMYYIVEEQHDEYGGTPVTGYNHNSIMININNDEFTKWLPFF